MLSTEQRIEALITPAIAAMGYELVRLKLMGGAKQPTLQIMADRLDGASISVEDCTRLSHSIGALLEVEDPLKTAYMLEISSAGIDRPLTKPEHYPRQIGKEIKVETALPIEGRRRFKGTLEAVEEDQIILRMDGEACVLPFNNIHSAQLVFSEDLLKTKAQKKKVI